MNQSKLHSGRNEDVTPPATPAGKSSESSADKMSPKETTLLILCIVGFAVGFVVWAVFISGR
jgi:hypothetical protein